MKKVKILTSLSALAITTATAPLVSTSCSYYAFTFDGEYEVDEVLSRKWCEKNLSNGELWTTPEELDMSEGGYNNPDAISYIQQNVNSSKLYMNFIVFSMIGHFKTKNPEGCPPKVKFHDTAFIFNATSNTFKVSFSIDLYNVETNDYEHYFSMRSKEDKVLQILCVSQFQSEIAAIQKDFMIGADYTNHLVDYGTEIRFYQEETGQWSDWQEVSINNDFTKYLADSFATLYLPEFLMPEGVEFKEKQFGLNLTLVYDEDGEGAEVFDNSIWIKKDRNYLFNLQYLIDDIITFSDDDVEITIDRENAGLIVAPGRYALALYADPVTFVNEVTLTIKVSYSSYGSVEQFDFKVIAIDNLEVA